MRAKLVYRVKVDCTGEIFESPMENGIKWVYHQARHALRGYLCNVRYYDLKSCIIQFGVLLENGKTESFIPEHNVASIVVSVIDCIERVYVRKCNYD